MVLCDVCERINLKEILLQCFLRRDSGLEDQYRRRRLYSLPKDKALHSHTYATLKAASDEKCDFCSLVWRLLVEKNRKRYWVHEEISPTEEERFSGHLTFASFFRNDAMSSKNEPPKIDIRMRPHSSQESSANRRGFGPACTIEAFAPRGMFTFASTPVQETKNIQDHMYTLRPNPSQKNFHQTDMVFYTHQYMPTRQNLVAWNKQQNGFKLVSKNILDVPE